MSKAATHTHPIGMKNLIEKVHKSFPEINFGYFNPPKEKFQYFKG
jgi:hypothetical protein